MSLLLDDMVRIANKSNFVGKAQAYIVVEKDHVLDVYISRISIT